MMAPGIKQCPKCTVHYDRDKYLPRVLTCGHTFCNTCLKEAKMVTSKEDNPRCETCKMPWLRKKVVNIPICYQMMPADAGEAGPSAAIKKTPCSRHAFELEFWCDNCSKIACKQCLVIDHQECSFTLIENAAGKARLTLLNKMKDMKDRIERQRQGYFEISSETNAALDNVKTFKETVDQLFTELTDKKNTLDDINSIITNNEVMLAESSGTNWNTLGSERLIVELHQAHLQHEKFKEVNLPEVNSHYLLNVIRKINDTVNKKKQEGNPASQTIKTLREDETRPAETALWELPSPAKRFKREDSTK